jgi:hypothetical protein
MRVVFPIPALRRIVRVDDQGEVVSVRRSARKGTPLDLFDRLVSWPTLVAHPNLTIELLLCDEDHVRGPEAGRSRSGRRTRDPGQRRLNAVIERIALQTPADALALLPVEALSAPFTTRQLAAQLGTTRILATRIIYCLRALDLVVKDGADGRAPLYKLAA